MSHTPGRMVDPGSKEAWVERFRAALAAKDLSVRGLARLMAAQAGDTSSAMVETCRRKISKWLSLDEATLPSPSAQRQVSDLLDADLRVTRRTNWQILEDRLAKLEDLVDAVREGQQNAVSRQESMANALSSLQEMLDARLPTRRDRGQQGSA